MSYRRKPDVEAIRKYKRIRQDEINKLRKDISLEQALKKRLDKKNLEKKNVISRGKIKCVRK